MNKADLINLVSEKAGITRIKAEVVVNTVFDSMAEELKLGHRIEIRGFGALGLFKFESLMPTPAAILEPEIRSPLKQNFRHSLKRARI